MSTIFYCTEYLTRLGEQVYYSSCKRFQLVRDGGRVSGTGRDTSGGLGSNLEALRIAAGFETGLDLARAAGVAKGVVSKGERGKEVPFPDEIDKLEAVLGERPMWYSVVPEPKRVLSKR